MTEPEWRVCSNPALMLELLRDKVSDRKLRLFAVACCRRVPHLMKDKRCLAAVEVAERYADGLITEEELTASRSGAWSVVDSAAWAAEAVLRSEAMESAAEAAAWTTVGWTAAVAQAAAQAELLREIIGNPFHPLGTSAHPHPDPDVLAIARRVHDERDFVALPILADALEDAGCTDTALLAHLRGPGPHARGCWAVDWLTGAS